MLLSNKELKTRNVSGSHSSYLLTIFRIAYVFGYIPFRFRLDPITGLYKITPANLIIKVRIKINDLKKTVNKTT